MNEVKEIKEKVKKLKLLFVDDEKEIRDGMGTFLKKFFDVVVICSDGLEGVETFKKNQDFDVIITDLLMPKMDGAQMVEKIKEIKPDIITIFITASRNSMIHENPTDIIFKKPLSFEDMIEVMKRIEESS